MKIGTLRLLPKGTKVWSISLQMNVTFHEDVIIELDSKIYSYNNDERSFYLNEKEFFFKMKILFGNRLNCFPGLADKANGDLGVINIDDTLPYEMPKPMFFDMIYKHN